MKAIAHCQFPWIEVELLNFPSEAASIDTNINMTYDGDDIWLRMMQRASPEQQMGAQFYYFGRHRLHFTRLTDESTLQIKQNASAS